MMPINPTSLMAMPHSHEGLMECCSMGRRYTFKMSQLGELLGSEPHSHSPSKLSGYFRITTILPKTKILVESPLVSSRI